MVLATVGFKAEMAEAARRDNRFDSIQRLRKMAMVVMQEKEFRGGLRPACRLDPEISRRDTRNAELLNQALLRPLILAQHDFATRAKKKNSQGQKNLSLDGG